MNWLRRKLCRHEWEYYLKLHNAHFWMNRPFTVVDEGAMIPAKSICTKCGKTK